jgi:hypothetical protein
MMIPMIPTTTSDGDEIADDGPFFILFSIFSMSVRMVREERARDRIWRSIAEYR